MSNHYRINATLDGRQIPMFELNADIQGIVSEEHAKKIAEAVINPFGDRESHINACRVERR